MANTSTDWQALCAELAQSLADEFGVEREYNSGEPLLGTGALELLSRARDAAAQPEPEGPISESELAAMWNQQADAFNQWESLDSGEQLAWAHARALARWGRPTIEPVPEEMDDLFWKHSSEIGPSLGVGLAHEDAPALICEALARWGRPTIEPVPVNERLPGPEDCDEEGRCWWSAPETNTKCAVWCFGPKYPPSMFGVISWLPHHALPVPQP